MTNMRRKPIFRAFHIICAAPSCMRSYIGTSLVLVIAAYVIYERAGLSLVDAGCRLFLYGLGIFLSRKTNQYLYLSWSLLALKCISFISGRIGPALTAAGVPQK